MCVVNLHRQPFTLSRRAIWSVEKILMAMPGIYCHRTSSEQYPVAGERKKNTQTHMSKICWTVNCNEIGIYWLLFTFNIRPFLLPENRRIGKSSTAIQQAYNDFGIISPICWIICQHNQLACNSVNPTTDDHFLFSLFLCRSVHCKMLWNIRCLLYRRVGFDEFPCFNHFIHTLSCSRSHSFLLTA